jgi:hypothetical protein
MVADRHHGDDFLTIQEQGQRPFMDYRDLDRVPLLIDAANGLGEARIVRGRDAAGTRPRRRHCEPRRRARSTRARSAG